MAAGVGVEMAHPPLVVTVTADPAALIERVDPVCWNRTTRLGGCAKR
jgi:hypothetical protein